jgi:hypothetical protein
MIRLTSNIKIGKYAFKGVVNCEIESGWDQLTDTCKIEIPRRISWDGNPLVFGQDPILKKGDKVVVNLGYNDDNKEFFTGYLVRISTSNPCIIECEDEMWKLKQKTFTKSYKKVTLKQLLTDMLRGEVSFEAPDVDLGPFRISKATVVQVLDELRNTYFLKSFFRNGKLYVGLAYWPKLQKEHKLHFTTHVVSNDLEYVKKEDVKIKLRVIVIKSDNTKQEYEYGDKEGEERTLTYYDITKAQADKTAGIEIERLRYDGYTGSLTIFGAPQVLHGDVVNLEDPFYPERDGRYLVKDVKPSFGMSGFRQVITLDSKV